jgi:GMP synthase (glutamine-hydrolysing)
MKSAVAIRHVAFEDVGVLEDILPEFGYELTYLDAGVDGLWQALHADLLIVLGGPIGVYESVEYPFLNAEIEMVSRRIDANLPTLGICLGAQILAFSRGLPVQTGRSGKEIGWKPLTLHGPELAELDGVEVLHWHGDTWVTLPDEGSLASTKQYANQAFSFGSRILGLQFHCELKAQNFEKWLIGHACELSAAKISPVSLRADAKLYAAGLEKAGSALFRRWLAGLD